jgi:hypothetical protein
VEFAQAILFIFRVAALCAMCAAAITLAVVAVCRWQKWAPINITVNVNDYRPGSAPDDDQ